MGPILDKTNKNKGFSLVEIIVVIALMAIVTGASMSIFSWIRTHRVEKLTENISDCINDVRTSQLSKDGSYYLKIIKDGEEYKGRIFKAGTLVKEKVIGSVGIIEVIEEVSSTKRKVTAQDYIQIEFDKSTGGIYQIMIVNSSSGVAKAIKGKISISYSDLNRDIEISTITGKHYIE